MAKVDTTFRVPTLPRVSDKERDAGLGISLVVKDNDGTLMGELSIGKGAFGSNVLMQNNGKSILGNGFLRGFVSEKS